MDRYNNHPHFQESRWPRNPSRHVENEQRKWRSYQENPRHGSTTYRVPSTESFLEQLYQQQNPNYQSILENDAEVCRLFQEFLNPIKNAETGGGDFRSRSHFTHENQNQDSQPQSQCEWLFGSDRDHEKQQGKYANVPRQRKVHEIRDDFELMRKLREAKMKFRQDSLPDSDSGGEGLGPWRFQPDGNKPAPLNYNLPRPIPMYPRHPIPIPLDHNSARILEECNRLTQEAAALSLTSLPELEAPIATRGLTNQMSSENLRQLPKYSTYRPEYLLLVPKKPEKFPPFKPSLQEINSNKRMEIVEFPPFKPSLQEINSNKRMEIVEVEKSPKPKPRLRRKKLGDVRDKNKTKENLVCTRSGSSMAQGRPSILSLGVFGATAAAALEAEDPGAKSLDEGIAYLQASEWYRNVLGLKVIMEKSNEDEEEDENLLNKLNIVLPLIQKHLKSPSSKLSRQSIRCLTYLFPRLGCHLDSYLKTIADRLFALMASTNKFLREECENSLLAMIRSCSQPRVIRILESVATKHRQMAVRVVALRLLRGFFDNVGAEEALVQFPELILPLLFSTLGEKTADLRDEAKQALKVLIPVTRFDAFVSQFVSRDVYFSICQKLEKIKDEVFDRAPVMKRSKVKL